MNEEVIKKVSHLKKEIAFHVLFDYILRQNINIKYFHKNKKIDIFISTFSFKGSYLLPGLLLWT